MDLQGANSQWRIARNYVYRGQTREVEAPSGVGSGRVFSPNLLGGLGERRELPQ